MNALKLLNHLLKLLRVLVRVTLSRNLREVTILGRVSMLPVFALEMDAVDHVLLALGFGSQASPFFGFLIFASGHIL